MKKIIIVTTLTNFTVCLAILLIFNFFWKAPKIMVADFDILRETIVAKTITTLSNKDDPSQIEKAVNRFQIVLSQMAKKKNAIVIDKNAVIGSGQKDITSDLQNLISDL